MQLWKAVLALTVVASGASAQSFTGLAVVDSANAARAAYRRAVQATDASVALGEIQRAALAWPSQPAYTWASALLAARARDTAATLTALEDYASLSLGRPLAGVESFAFLAGSPRFERVRVQHDAHRAPIAASRLVLAMDDSAFWPEAADYDPRSQRWYLGSVRRGVVVQLDSTGRVTRQWSADSLGVRGSILGVRVDAARRRLWVTASAIPQYEKHDPQGAAKATLLQVGLDDGRIKQRWELPAAPGGPMLGELAIGPEGDVFITDSRQLYRKRPGSDSLEVIRHGLFYSLQGIAPVPSGEAVYLADYSHGLLRLDLHSGEVIRLADAPRSTSLGCDGLAWFDGALIAVQNGVAPARVMRFDLDKSGREIRRAEVIDRNASIADEPTVGTIVGNEFIYVANSQWEKYDAGGKVRPGARLKGPILLAVRLK